MRVLVENRWQTASDVLDLLNHPGHADQSSHGRKKKGAAEPPGERGTGVDALPRMKSSPTVRRAAMGANPDHGTTSNPNQPIYRDAGRAGQRWTPEMGPPPYGAFEENCTNAVMTFEMRMRGYDVKSAPLDVLDKYGYAAGRTYPETDQQLASNWRMPDGSAHGRSFASQKWRSFREIDAEIESWPEGGRGYVTTGRHVFNVVKTKGKAQYVEAQFAASPSRIVTAQYKKKFKGSGWSGEAPQEAKLVRLDDLVPTDGIMESVVAT